MVNYVNGSSTQHESEQGDILQQSEETFIYIIDYMNFWSPSPRAATKKFAIKCAFLLTQTVYKHVINALDSLNSKSPGTLENEIKCY